MATNSERFKHESLEDPQSIVKYLSALQEGFENGALQFSSNDRRLVLEPHGLIRMEMEARRKGSEITLTLKLSWSEDTKPDNSEKGPLIIQPLAKS